MGHKRIFQVTCLPEPLEWGSRVDRGVVSPLPLCSARDRVRAAAGQENGLPLGAHQRVQSEGTSGRRATDSPEGS